MAISGVAQTQHGVKLTVRRAKVSTETFKDKIREAVVSKAGRVKIRITDISKGTSTKEVHHSLIEELGCSNKEITVRQLRKSKFNDSNITIADIPVSCANKIQTKE